MDTPTITTDTIKMRIIYVRLKGTFMDFEKNRQKMFTELFEFATKYNLIKNGATKIMTIYHDNPFVTDSKNLRTSVAMSIPKDSQIKCEGRIGDMYFEGKYAIFHFNISLGEYEEAWKYPYSENVMKNASYTLRDAPPFELYVTETPTEFTAKSLTDIYIPID